MFRVVAKKFICMLPINYFPRYILFQPVISCATSVQPALDAQCSVGADLACTTTDVCNKNTNTPFWSVSIDGGAPTTYASFPSAITVQGTSSRVAVVTFTNSNGKTSDPFSVTIAPVDNTPPSIVCEGLIVSADGNCDGTGTVSASWTDNCAADGSASQALSSHGADSTASHTFTATDGSNNAATCTATLTVRDTTAPVITCADATVSADGNCDGTGTVSASWTDNCAASNSTSQVLSSHGADSTASHTFTATDDSSNSVSCSATLTVRDTTAPVITCADATVSADGNCDGTGTVSASWTDNCAASNSASQVLSSHGADSSASHTFTTTDGSNSVSCSATLTVRDTTAPTASQATLTTPATLWPPNHTWQAASVAVSATDNCDSNAACSISVSGITFSDAAKTWSEAPEAGQCGLNVMLFVLVRVSGSVVIGKSLFFS